MNIIFLDIDGPLCNHRVHIALGRPGKGMVKFDPVGVHLIDKLCRDHEAKIVISSTWRIGQNYISMFETLGHPLHSHMVPDVDAWGTDHLGPQRGDEIQRWIDAHGVDQFVIIDDSSDMGLLVDHLVKCDAYDGIGFRQYLIADAMLQGKEYPPLVLPDVAGHVSD
jgi:hypothetical protein